MVTDFKSFIQKREQQRYPWLFVQKVKGKGRGHHGHKGRPGEVGGSLPDYDAAVKQLLPAKNRKYLSMKPGQGIYEAIDRGKGKWGRNQTVNSLMYSPKTGKLLAGGRTHPGMYESYVRGGTRADFDTYVKMEITPSRGGDPPGLRVWLDRHQASSETDAWDKAFDAAKVARAVGMPDETILTITYYAYPKRGTRRAAPNVSGQQIAAELGLGEV